MNPVTHPDFWLLYELMQKSRLFEEAVTRLWNDGYISGEMHLGTGEEAIIAGIVSQLLPGDAIALDHRGSAAFLIRSVDPVLILREMLGKPDGLCGGMGGHMHMFSKDHLMASSGIVGAAGPAACGFALAAQNLHPGGIAVAFFGEGAMNQGMLLESINLAAVWNLPIIFACKDDGWAITTQPGDTTGGKLDERVSGLGVRYVEVDGLDIEQTWQAANQAIEQARNGKGPTFLHAHCVHLEGHFLGYPLLRMARNPLQEMPGVMGPVLRSFLQHGGGRLHDRLAGIRYILSASQLTAKDPRRLPNNDPVLRARSLLESEPQKLKELDERLEQEINAILGSAVQEVVLP